MPATVFLNYIPRSHFTAGWLISIFCDSWEDVFSNCAVVFSLKTLAMPDDESENESSDVDDLGMPFS